MWQHSWFWSWVLVSSLDFVFNKVYLTHQIKLKPNNQKTVNFVPVTITRTSIAEIIVLAILILISFYVQVIVQPGINHQMTSEMVKEASDWFDKFFKP